MITIELFTSDESLSPEAERELACRLRDCLTTGHEAPPEVIDRARELTHVLVHRPRVWATGGPDPALAPRYLVRVTVPGTWIGNDFAKFTIPMLTQAIAEFEGDPQRLREQPHCVVQVIGLHEGALGTYGRVTSSSDVTRMMTENYRDSGQADGTIDPVCGMTVDPATARYTLTVDGVDYAFCASVCRKVFAEDHGILLEAGGPGSA